MKIPRIQAVWLTVALVLLADQALKIWIKMNYSLGESHQVLGPYLQLHFIENEGMAFGMTLPGEWGKLALSLFRILAVGFIGWWLRDLAKEKNSALVLYGVGLIFAGALGNILDSAFYGLIFSASDPLHPAQLFPAEGGYGSFLHGHVVDMLRMELFDIRLFGTTYHFFEPIFNLADTAITFGVGLFLIGSLLPVKDAPQETTPASDATAESTAQEPTATPAETAKAEDNGPSEEK
jgi:signal peptidase II